MHTTETFARTVSAMEADTSPAADEAGKDLVATVKEEPQDDIKVCRQYRLYEYLCEPRASHVPVRIHIHIHTSKASASGEHFARCCYVHNYIAS